jgi:uncharacterized protein (DUF488 family)
VNAHATSRDSDSTTIYTLGHSTRSLEEFFALAKEHEVRRLVDVRRYPGSRRFPHFSRETLAAAAPEVGLAYEHAPEFGGRRDPAADSSNTAWRNAAFRAYADHAATPEFRAALDRLVAAAERDPLAIFCAEAVPWRCHRRIMADALVARGVAVRHIIAPGRSDAHELHPDARVLPDGTVIYPGEESGQMELIG